MYDKHLNTLSLLLSCVHAISGISSCHRLLPEFSVSSKLVNYFMGLDLVSDIEQLPDIFEEKEEEG